jgi:hypothetical protein
MKIRETQKTGAKTYTMFTLQNLIIPAIMDFYNASWLLQLQ